VIKKIDDFLATFAKYKVRPLLIDDDLTYAAAIVIIIIAPENFSVSMRY